MTSIDTTTVPDRQVIEDLRRAAELQYQHGWKSVHWLDHKTGCIGIFGALRLAIYGIASTSADPAFIPTDQQRARVWRATEVLNDHVAVHYGVRYAFDWNGAICTSTDDAVRLFRSAAVALERTTK